MIARVDGRRARRHHRHRRLRSRAGAHERRPREDGRDLGRVDRRAQRHPRAADRRDDEAASDLALPAARQALEQAGVDAADLDLVVVATSTPDMLFPSTAAILAEALGAKNAAAYDLLAGCSGFLYGALAGARRRSGGSRRGRSSSGSEMLSKIVDWTDRSTCILFGDGAGAAVVERVEERRHHRLRARRGREPRRRPLPAGGRLAPAA